MNICVYVVALYIYIYIYIYIYVRSLHGQVSVALGGCRFIDQGYTAAAHFHRFYCHRPKPWVPVQIRTPAVINSLCIGLHKQEYHFAVDLRYMILQLYSEYGTIPLINIQAPESGPEVLETVHAVVRRSRLLFVYRRILVVITPNN